MLRNVASIPRQMPLTCNGHTRPVVHLDFGGVNDTGYFLISACKDGRPMLRHGETGDWVGTFVGHKGAVWGVALNKNASLAATAAADFTAKIWSASSGKMLLDIPHKHIVKSATFDERSERLVTGGYEKLIRIYDLEKLTNEPDLFMGHERPVTRAIFCHSSRCILSAADDRTLRLWDRSSGKEVKCLNFNESISCPELSPDGSLLTVASGNHVSLWDVERLEKKKEFELPIKVLSATLHPEKHLLVCGGDDLKLHKYNCETGEEIDTLKGHFGTIHAVKFSPDGELFASGSEDGTLRLWQTNVGKPYGIWKCAQSRDNLFRNAELK